MNEFTDVDDKSTSEDSSFTDKNKDESTNVDTHSVEHQLKVLQQRNDDKDEFINTLKEENQKTREMYASLEERMKNMEDIKEVLNRDQDVSNQETKLDENELVGKVIENLNKQQIEQMEEQNFSSVKNRLSEEFGMQHVEEKVNQAAQAEGLSYEDMVRTARKSPKAFYKLMGLEQAKPSSPTPTRSSVSAPVDNGNTKDFAYYSRLMRENYNEYMKPETQREFRKLFNEN